MKNQDILKDVRDKVKRQLLKLFSKEFWEDYDSEKKTIPVFFEDEDIQITGEFFAKYHYIPINGDDEIDNDGAWFEGLIYFWKDDFWEEAPFCIDVKDL